MELDSALEFVKGKLLNDSQILASASGVFEGAAPLEATYPFISVNVIYGEDIAGVNNVRCGIEAEILVVAVGLESDAVNVKALSARADALLHGASGTADGKEIVTVTRVRPHRANGYENGQKFLNLGGYYRIETGV
jgi:hypothetical protein